MVVPEASADRVEKARRPRARRLDSPRAPSPAPRGPVSAARRDRTMPVPGRAVGSRHAAGGRTHLRRVPPGTVARPDRSSRDGPPRQLTIGARNDRLARFSPDGRWLAFISDRRLQTEAEPARPKDLADREDKDQVHVLPIDAPGEARRVSDLPRGVEAFEWSPDGQRLVVVSTSHGATFEEDARRRGKARKPRSHEEPDSDYRFIDRLGYMLNGPGFQYDRVRHLWLVDVASGAATRLTDGTSRTSSRPGRPTGRASPSYRTGTATTISPSDRPSRSSTSRRERSTRSRAAPGPCSARRHGFPTAGRSRPSGRSSKEAAAAATTSGCSRPTGRRRTRMADATSRASTTSCPGRASRPTSPRARPRV